MMKYRNRHNFAPTQKFHSTFSSNGTNKNPYDKQNPFRVPAKFYSISKQEQIFQTSSKSVEQCRYKRKYQNSYLKSKQDPLSKTYKKLEQNSVHQKVWNNYVGEMEFLKNKLQHGGISQFQKTIRISNIGTFSTNSNANSRKNKLLENPFYRKNLISALKQSNKNEQINSYGQYQSVSSASNYKNYQYSQFEDVSNILLPYSLQKLLSNQYKSKKSSVASSPRQGERSPYQYIYDSVKQIQPRSRKQSLNDSFGPKKGKQNQKQIQQILTRVGLQKLDQLTNNFHQQNTDEKQVIQVRGKKFYKNKIYPK